MSDAVTERAESSPAAAGAGDAGGAGLADVPEVFPPTLREVMLRPWWIGMLLFALAVAAVFAWLGQWQLASAIDRDPPPPGMTEQVRPISEVTQPGEYLPEPLVGQRVEVAGTFVAGDFLIVSSRFNEGEEGYWVTAQLRVAPGDGIPSPTSLAVALGWAPDRENAEGAIADFEARAGEPVTVTGRLVSDEGPAAPPRDGSAQVMTRMSPAALLSQWHDIEGLNVYRPFLVVEGGVALPQGISPIYAPAPDERSSINWLNVFYAIEWAIFAGFAFYMWYRLARDAWEKEVESLTDP